MEKDLKRWKKRFRDEKKEKCYPPIPEKKGKARSTLHNFCQLGLAPARSSLVFFFALPCSSTDKEKKKGQRAHQLTEVSNTSRPGTCSRFRPEKKKKSAVDPPQFLSTRPGTCPKFFGFFFFALPCASTGKKKKKKNWSQQSLPLSLHNLCKLGLTPARSSDLKKRKVRSTLRNFCKLGLTPARSSDPKKKRVEGNGNDNDKTKAKRQRRDREETEKRQRRDREETEKRQRRDREETEKRQRRDREETEKRQRRDREETRDKKKKKGAVDPPQFLWAPPCTCSKWPPKKKEKCDPLSAISVNSAQHLLEVQTPTRKKRKVRSTLHNFWKLGLAPVPGSDPHKKKEKCDPLSTISVSSSWHLLEVLYFFFALPCASTEKKKRKKKTKKKKKLHRSRVPACTHNLMTAFDISVVLRHLSQKNWTDLGACFDYTHISQTWCIWNDNLYPTSTTRHMDGPWNDQPFWWARTSSQHRNLLKISMLLFFLKKKS